MTWLLLLGGYGASIAFAARSLKRAGGVFRHWGRTATVLD